VSREMTLLPFLAQFDLILFDLDGVILDSNRLKVETMREVLHPYDGPAADSFMESFRTNFGRSRREHFLAFHGEYLLRHHGFEQFYQEAGGRYADLLRARYAAAPLCDDAAQVIRELNMRGTATHVVTGTMTGEARAVLEAKGLASEFQSVLGSPASKLENARNILSRPEAARAKAILIGDATEDARVAGHCSIRFLFAEKYSLIDAQHLMDRLGLTSLTTFSSLRGSAIVRESDATTRQKKNERHRHVES
jgi:phosphoglycolate phosphatase